MTIYLAIGSVDYERSYLFGAYDTEDKAEDRIAEVKAEYKYYADSYYVHEIELNEVRMDDL